MADEVRTTTGISRGGSRGLVYFAGSTEIHPERPGRISGPPRNPSRFPKTIKLFGIFCLFKNHDRPIGITFFTTDAHTVSLGTVQNSSNRFCVSMKKRL